MNLRKLENEDEYESEGREARLPNRAALLTATPRSKFSSSENFRE
jgi:hypothetical protein